MSTATNVTRAPSRARCRVRLAAFVAAALVIGPPRWSIADAPKARTFPSAAAAAEALFQAVRNDDRQAIKAILGSKDDLASCGDQSRDAGERARFVEKYQEMHRLVRAPDGTVVLFIGAENWPFPIPLVPRGGWHFDAEAGKREVTFRRIGADEATAIEVCRTAVEAATHDETPKSTADPIVGYAERLAGAARASSATTGGATPDEQPFHGYRFVVLKKSGGIMVVAYPAEYRSSGVMTFVVGEDGVVYERDLGPDTVRVARTLKARPASGWRAVDQG